jgi:glycosyltransferase involved in cell wall biosynthesis
MRLAVLTGSVSRLAGGTFSSIKRPMQEMLAAFPMDIGVFGLRDKFTHDDLPDWTPLIPEIFPTIGLKAFGYAPGYFDAVDRFQPSIVQTHGIWMHFSYVSLSISKKRAVPYIINPHGMLDPWSVNNSLWKKKVAGMLYQNEHLRNATCLRALCRSEAISMREYGLQNPICQIPNGIDFSDSPVLNPAPWCDAVEPGKKILLFLGRIHEKKGLKNLIVAWAQALKDDFNLTSDWVLIIAGWDSTGHQQELLKLVDILQVHENIRFIGPQFDKQKTAAYFHADAFILPSFSEGLPMTVLEAWAHGLPVLMTPQCNIPEGFQANAAIKVEPVHTEIATGLMKLFSLTDRERQEMGNHGLSLVKRKFTWEKVAGEMHDVHKWILGGGTPPECVKFKELD